MSRIIRDAECFEKTGLSNERRRQLEHDGLFPKRFKLVPGVGQNGAMGYLENEVDAWIAERVSDRETAA